MRINQSSAGNSQPDPEKLKRSKEQSDSSSRDLKRNFGGCVFQVTDATFKQEVLESAILVLVDFWAPWCGPCRMLAPVVDEIAAQYGGLVKVVKINTDENPGVASQYGIRSIPTLMIFNEGQRVDMIVGAVPGSTLSNTLEKHL